MWKARCQARFEDGVRSRLPIVAIPSLLNSRGEARLLGASTLSLGYST